MSKLPTRGLYAGTNANALANGLFHIVDTNDITQDATGSSFKITGASLKAIFEKNLYTDDGSLAGNRIVTIGGFSLTTTSSGVATNVFFENTNVAGQVNMTYSRGAITAYHITDSTEHRITVAGRLRLGTQGANNLIFETNSVEKMRLTANGELLIGSTTANAKLYIVSSSGTAFRVSTTAGAFNFNIDDATGKINYNVSNPLLEIGVTVGTPLNSEITINRSINGYNGIQILNTSTGSSAASAIHLGVDLANQFNMQRLGVNQVGNLSGSSIPLSTLGLFDTSLAGVSGASPVAIRASVIYNVTGITSTNAAYRLDSAGIRIDSLSNIHTSASARLHIVSASGTALKVDTTGGAGTFTVKDDGLIGIGTTSPTDGRLQINNSNALVDSIRLIDTTGSNRTVYINTGGLAGFTGVVNSESAMILSASSGTNVRVRTVGSNTIHLYTNSDTARGLFIGTTNLVGFSVLTPTAKADIEGASTAASSLRIRSGTAPTSPNDGDIWYDGTDLKFRNGATTKTFTLV